MTSLLLRVGDTFFDMSGISVGAGEYLRIFYDDRMNLCIEAAGQSAYGCRSMRSSDDLIAVTGTGNIIEVTADAQVKVKIKPRGLYL